MRGRLHIAVTVLAVWIRGVAASATPVPETLYLYVETVGEKGLQPAGHVRVNICAPTGVLASGCSNPVRCLEGCRYFEVTGFTNPDGSYLFHDQPVRYPYYAAFVTVGGTVLRGLGRATYASPVIVDPTSEAASDLLEGRGYNVDQALALLQHVRAANRHTDFAGLSVTEAVARARDVALTNAVVLASLPTWTPTLTRTVTPTKPTSTPTPTATPTITHTRRPTATPRACIGDCGADGQVRIEELIAGINLALGLPTALDCSAGYGDAPDVVDLVNAVNNGLGKCAPSVPLPDLIAESVSIVSSASCTSDDAHLTYCLTICAANVGNARAERTSFLAVIAGDVRYYWILPAMDAGDGTCRLYCSTDFEGIVRADSENAVLEGREKNNDLSFRITTPTPPASAERPRCGSSGRARDQPRALAPGMFASRIVP